MTDKVLIFGREFNLTKQRIRYRIDTILAYRKMCNDLSHERDVYFETVDDGVSVLRPKWYPK